MVCSEKDHDNAAKAGGLVQRPGIAGTSGEYDALKRLL